jgi:hypothetical protein
VKRSRPSFQLRRLTVPHTNNHGEARTKAPSYPSWRHNDNHARWPSPKDGLFQRCRMGSNSPRRIRGPPLHPRRKRPWVHHTFLNTLALKRLTSAPSSRAPATFPCRSRRGARSKTSIKPACGCGPDAPVIKTVLRVAETSSMRRIRSATASLCPTMPNRPACSANVTIRGNPLRLFLTSFTAFVPRKSAAHRDRDCEVRPNVLARQVPAFRTTIHVISGPARLFRMNTTRPGEDGTASAASSGRSGGANAW